jgi:hypothetical protein
LSSTSLNPYSDGCGVLIKKIISEYEEEENGLNPYSDGCGVLI